MAAITPSPNIYDIPERPAQFVHLTAGEDLKQGWLAGVNPTTGKAAKAGTAGVIILGRVECNANNDEEVTLRRGCFLYPADSAVTLDDKLIGKPAYAQNQNSVTTTSSVGARPAGLVLGMEGDRLLIDTEVAPLIPVPTA